VPEKIVAGGGPRNMNGGFIQKKKEKRPGRAR